MFSMNAGGTGPGGTGPPRGKTTSQPRAANGRGKQLAGGQGFHQAVPAEFFGQQVAGAQDLAGSIETLDLQTDRVPVHPVGQPVGTGDDKSTTGPAGEDFAFLDEELDVFGGLDGQQGRCASGEMRCGIHGALLKARVGSRAGHRRAVRHSCPCSVDQGVGR
jgi:hypothetical protein